MKKLILTLIFVISIIFSQTAKLQAASEQSADEIEKYISERRQEIEKYYQNRLTELQLKAKADIRLLEIAEKAQPTWAGFQEWAEFAETILQINGYENISYGLFKTIPQTPAERLAVALSRITQRKNEILVGLEWQALKLEKQRKYASTTGLDKLKKNLQEKLLAPEPEPTHGVVVGIIYSQDDPVAIIDGTTVRQGDTIHGVKVIRINKDSVEFTKDDNAWTQKPREIRATNWK